MHFLIFVILPFSLLSRSDDRERHTHGRVRLFVIAFCPGGYATFDFDGVSGGVLVWTIIEARHNGAADTLLC